MQLALCVGKEEAKLLVTPLEISSDLAQHVALEFYEELDLNSSSVQVMEGTPSIEIVLSPHHENMSSSRAQDIATTTNSVPDRFLLPNLNISLSLEESSDNSSGGCIEQVLHSNKARNFVVARKFRLECLQGKFSQIGKGKGNLDWSAFEENSHRLERVNLDETS